MGGFSAIREIEEYKYPYFLSFPGEWGEEREGDFDLFLTQFKKNFKLKEILSITKTFKHKKQAMIWSIIGEKKSFGADSSRKK